MLKKFLKLSTVSPLVFLMACGHPLDVTGDGDIESSSGDRDCSLEDAPCDNIINGFEGDYVERYSGVPRPGSYFSGWNDCGTQYPDCKYDVGAQVVIDNHGKTMPPLIANFEPYSGYTLFFSDEFNVDGAPDSNNWTLVEERQIGNQDHCNTTDPENAKVENGNLVITLKQSENHICSYQNQNTGSNIFQYTSASLSTRVDAPANSGGVHNGFLVSDGTNSFGKQAGMPFGIYEIRAKIPKGIGTWPAIWLNGVDQSDWTETYMHPNYFDTDPSQSIPENMNSIWPDVGEIDIMEAVGWHEYEAINQPTGTWVQPNNFRAYQSLHRTNEYIWPNRPSNDPDPANAWEKTGVGMLYDGFDEPISNGFHVYKLDWQPNSIKFYVDNVLVQKLILQNGQEMQTNGFILDANGDNSFYDVDGDDPHSWPFNRELGYEYELILNLAYGGDWGRQSGISGKTYTYAEMDADTFGSGEPVEMLIDYVRVYKMN